MPLTSNKTIPSYSYSSSGRIGDSKYSVAGFVRPIHHSANRKSIRQQPGFTQTTVAIHPRITVGKSSPQWVDLINNGEWEQSPKLICVKGNQKAPAHLVQWEYNIIEFHLSSQCFIGAVLLYSGRYEHR